MGTVLNQCVSQGQGFLLPLLSFHDIYAPIQGTIFAYPDKAILFDPDAEPKLLSDGNKLNNKFPLMPTVNAAKVSMDKDCPKKETDRREGCTGHVFVIPREVRFSWDTQHLTGSLVELIE
eukprot:g4254.t1